MQVKPIAPTCVVLHRALCFAPCLFLLLGLAPQALAYETIVSLSPQITESLFLLKADKELVAVTTDCKRPKEVLVKEKIGSPLRPDIEKIVSLKPELVLGSREGNPPWIMERLKRLGLHVVYFDRPQNLDGLLANFLKLSNLLGRSGQGAAIVAELKGALARSQPGTLYNVLWQVEAEPLMVASTSSFANDIIRLAGGRNIVDTELPYPRINVEEAIVKAPDVIVLMDMGYNIEGEMKRWRGYLKDVRFVVMDSYITGSPNPITFLKAVRELEGARAQ